MVLALRLVAVAAAAFALQGCLARTAVSAVTLPVKVASKAYDLATTSQAEADQKAGRELRKADERRGREARKMAERCRKGRPLPDDDCEASRAN